MKKITSLFLFMFSIATLIPAIAFADIPPIPNPKPTPVCDYAAPKEGCDYVEGPDYNLDTYCGMILNCPTPNIDLSSITKTLRRGIKNDNNVKILQSFLNTKLNLSLVVDGSFGLKTKSAVITFQQNNGLVADGIVGLKTLGKMKTAL